MEVVVTTGAISHAKLQSNHHHQQTSIQFFYRSDALPVAQPTVSKHWRENITFHGLAYPKLIWGLPTVSLTTNSSWLPLGRVAMPLISPLMPVPLKHHHFIQFYQPTFLWAVKVWPRFRKLSNENVQRLLEMCLEITESSKSEEKLRRKRQRRRAV